MRMSSNHENWCIRESLQVLEQTDTRTICWNPGKLQTSFINIISAIQMQHGVRFRRCSSKTMQKIANRYFKKQLGVLKDGAAADVIVMDYNPFTPMNAEQYQRTSDVWNKTDMMVQTTVCNGKVLMKDREVLVCDEDKVMADCRQSAKELADDINEEENKKEK